MVLSDPSNILTKKVKIHSLSSKPELNNMVGTATRFDSAKNRYDVHLPTAQRIFSLKPDNLTPATFVDRAQSTIQELKMAGTAMYNDPMLREKVKKTYTDVDRRLPSGMKPEHLVGVLLTLVLVVIWKLGVMKTIFVSSFLLLIASVALPDLLNGAPWKVVVFNFPRRFKENLVQTTGFTWITDRMAIGCFVLLVLFIGKALIASPRSSSVSPGERMDLDLGGRYATAEDAVGITKQWTVDEIYKMGFEDATQEKTYGASLETDLPSNYQTMGFVSQQQRQQLDQQRKASSFSSAQDDDFKWNSSYPPPEPKRNKFGFGSAMALFAIGRAVKEMGFHEGKFDMQLLIANAKTLEPWKLAMLLFALYRLFSAFF